MREGKNQLAVALHYDKAGAPRVVAKGRGVIGEKIVEIAEANKGGHRDRALDLVRQARDEVKAGIDYAR